MADHGGTRPVIFWLQIVYLIVLFGLAYVRVALPGMLPVPDSFGPIPTPVVWFGALGAVFISLTGVFAHAKNWDPDYKYWHWSRPIVGAVMAVIAVLILQAGLLSLGTQSQQSATQPTLFYVVAFIIAYREETFRELIKRVADVIIKPAPSPTAPRAARMTPGEGSVRGGFPVEIMGNGLADVNEVRFGRTLAFHRIDSDTHLTVNAPPGEGAGPVPVVVAGKGGNSTPGQFTYTSPV